jgi:hypothetical protein
MGTHGAPDAFAPGFGADHVAGVTDMGAQSGLVGLDIIGPQYFSSLHGHVSSHGRLHPDCMALVFIRIRRIGIGIAPGEHLMDNRPDLVPIRSNGFSYFDHIK